MPTGIPLPRPAVRPMTLAMKALRVRYSFKTTPLRMVFSSGIPEPVFKKEREREVIMSVLYNRQNEKKEVNTEGNIMRGDNRG